MKRLQVVHGTVQVLQAAHGERLGRAAWLELGEGAVLSLPVPTWGLVKAPQLCRGLRASGAQAGRLGAACCAAHEDGRPGSSASLEPRPSALQTTKSQA